MTKGYIPCMLAPAQRRNRRREYRIDERITCSYETCARLNEYNFVLLRGEARILNRSGRGALLLSNSPLRVGQIVEVTTQERWGRRSVHLYEVRWARPEPSKLALGELQQAGCRLFFDRMCYWIF